MEHPSQDNCSREIPALSSPPEIRGYYQVDLGLTQTLYDISVANGCPLTTCNSRALTDFYSVLWRVFNLGNDTFTLKGKQGQWKQVDQNWLAKSTKLSIRTVKRRLKDLADIGVIKYSKHGYIPEKYLQVMPIEEVWREATSVDQSRSTDGLQTDNKRHSSDSAVAPSKVPSCHLPKCQAVPFESAELAQSNKRQETRQLQQDNLDLTAIGENAEISPPTSDRVFTSESERVERVEKEQGQPQQPQRPTQPLVDATQVEPELHVLPAVSTPQPFPKRVQTDAREKQPRRYRIPSVEELDRMNAARQSTAAA